MESTLFFGFLILLMLLSCTLLYLSTKQQALLVTPIAVAPWRYLGYALLMCSLVGWYLLLSPAAAFFLWLMLTSLILGCLPFLALFKERPQ